MNKSRPLSPHLQVYRLPLTGLISITHRATGVFLSFGLLVVVCLLVIIASSPDCFAATQTLLQGWIAQLFLWGFVYALFFHLCHGVRHLIWDAGSGFERDSMNRYAVIELLFSLLLTAIVFILFQTRLL